MITGPDGLTKTGPGTFTLSGINTYSAGTAITGGTLAVSADSRLGGPAGNLRFDGGTLRYLAGFGSSRLVTLSTAGGTVDTNGNSAALSGPISGTGSFAKIGGGTLTLLGTNTYTGGTTINAGTLLGNAASLQGDIVDNATLVFDQAGTGTHAGSISGTGTVRKQGAGTLTLLGANTYAGGTTISAGTLVGNVASLQGSIVDNATLVFDQPADGTYGGVVSGTLVKRGAGTLTLTGANSYAGGTAVDAGTLRVSTDSNLGALGAGLSFDGGTLQYVAGFASNRSITLNAGGTIDTDGNSATLAGPLGGAGSLTKIGGAHSRSSGPTRTRAGPP